ncbi:MAG: hypothetical protein NC041_02325 [Bacteroides sp.]|nr:hypothetical protein [Prevotella sp.]MCM1407561.1 hypothetical protein [Treponema brennaborense]MCM1469289.1 hypothetical protein [Bacteroides sp.]
MRIHIKAGCAAVVLMLAASCDFSAPETVQVSAAPTFSASAGNTDVKISSYMTLADIKKKLRSSAETAEIYNYIPDKKNNVMQYVLRYPLINKRPVPLNIAGVMENLNVVADVDRNLPDQTFSVPDLSINNREIGSVPLDLLSSFPGLGLGGTVVSGVTQVIDKEVHADIPLPSGAGFISADIADNGSRKSVLKITVNAPCFSQWQSVEKQVRISVRQPGGMNIDKTFAASALGPIVIEENLRGQKMTSAPLSVETHITLRFNNSTIIISPSPENISVQADLRIEKLENVMLQTDSSLAASLSPPPLRIAVPPEMKEWIESITFEELGFEIEIDNGLPSGSDLYVTLTAPEFGITSDNRKIFGSGTKTVQRYMAPKNYRMVPDAIDDFSVETNIEIQGLTDNGLLTLSGIIPGKPVAFKCDVKGIFNFSEVKVKTNQRFSGSFPSASQSSIDFSIIKDLFGEKVELETIPLYLFVSSPVLQELSAFKTSGGSSISGLVRVSYSESGVQKTDYLVSDTGYSPASPDDAAAPAQVYLVPPPDFEHLTEDLSVYAEEYFAGNLDDMRNSLSSDSENAKTAVDLARVLNKSPDNIRFDYDFSVNSVQLSAADIDALKKIGGDDLTISAILAIALPLKLSVKQTDGLAETEIYQMADIFSSDLLERRSATDITENMQTVLDGLKCLQLEIAYDNALLSSDKFFAAKLYALDKGSGFQKTAELREKNGTIFMELSASEVKQILNTYPFKPELSLRVPPGSYFIDRAACFNVNVKVNISADINRQFTLK